MTSCGMLAPLGTALLTSSAGRLLPVVLLSRKFTENQKVSGASQEMHPLKELAEPEQVCRLNRTTIRMGPTVV
jgi:hypothetical protein